MEGRPEQVRKAQLESNTEALSRMGTKGGINAGLIGADRKSQQEKDLDAFIERQENIFHVDDEGDVLPPDEKITESFNH